MLRNWVTGVEKGMGGKEIWWAARDWGICFFLIRIWKVLKLMERTVERFFKRADDNLLVLIPKWNQKTTRGLWRSWQRERIRVFTQWQKRNEKRKKWVNIPRRSKNSNGEKLRKLFSENLFLREALLAFCNMFYILKEPCTSPLKHSSHFYTCSAFGFATRFQSTLFYLF